MSSNAAAMPLTIGSVEAEAALLGCLLHLSADAGNELLARLQAEDFTDPRHRAVLAAVATTVHGGTRPDPITVLGEMRRQGLERSMTGDRSAGVFLLDVAAAAPVVASAQHYARIVVEHRVRRRAQEAACRLAQGAEAASLDHLKELALAELEAIFDQIERLTMYRGSAA